MFRECRENNIFIMVRGIATESRIHSLAPANSFPCTLWNVWTQRCDDVSGCGWWIGDELDTSFWWLNTNNKGIGLCGYPTWKWNKFSRKLIFAAFWSWNEILIIWSRFLWFDCSHKTFNGGIQIRKPVSMPLRRYSLFCDLNSFVLLMQAHKSCDSGELNFGARTNHKFDRRPRSADETQSLSNRHSEKESHFPHHSVETRPWGLRILTHIFKSNSSDQ